MPNVDINNDVYRLPPLDENPLFKHIKDITPDDVTSRMLEGPGILDALMQAVSVHLDREYQSGRITGSSYAEAYIGAVGAALPAAMQFALGKDQAYWAALGAQYQTRTAEIESVRARIGLEVAKMEFYASRYKALTAEAEYGLTKMNIVLTDANVCKVKKETEVVAYTLDNHLPIQTLILEEQHEAARGQTMNTRSDGTPIVGAMGKQNELYSQQITSYQRDIEMKVAKLYSDMWAAQKTIDEDLLPPSDFTIVNIQEVLQHLRSKADMLGPI